MKRPSKTKTEEQLITEKTLAIMEKMLVSDGGEPPELLKIQTGGREVIAKKLLAALGDEESVAVVFREWELGMVICALASWDSPLANHPAIIEMLEDMKELNRQAFGS